MPELWSGRARLTETPATPWLLLNFGEPGSLTSRHERIGSGKSTPHYFGPWELPVVGKVSSMNLARSRKVSGSR